jgi:uncharacterized membrane protein
MKNKLNLIFEYFLIGALGLLPILLITQIVLTVESLLRESLVGIYGRFESILLPGILLLGSIILVIYVGYLIKQDKAHILYFFEKIINRIPLLGIIYRVSQKVLRLFHDGHEKQITDSVFIEYPRQGLWVPAYVTNRTGAMLVVYVPTSPNPTSGFTLIVHESSVRKSPMTIEEVSSFIISLGADFPKSKEVSDLLLGGDGIKAGEAIPHLSE